MSEQSLLRDRQQLADSEERTQGALGEQRPSTRGVGVKMDGPVTKQERRISGRKVADNPQERFRQWRIEER